MVINERTNQTRDRILKAAGRLFYDHGYRAIGIDKIIAEAGVAKQSFYNHFPSKDEVMLAWIELAAQYGKAGEAQAVANRNDPLTAVVESVITRAKEASCRGCTFQTGAAEFAETDHPVHKAALEVKEQTLARYIEYARQEGAIDPARAGRQVFILIEGVWAAVQMYGQRAPLDGVLDLAKLVLGKA